MGDLLFFTEFHPPPKSRLAGRSATLASNFRTERGARVRRHGGRGRCCREATSPPARPAAAAASSTRGRRAVAAAAAGRSQPVTRAAREPRRRAREGAGPAPRIPSRGCLRRVLAPWRRRPAPLRAPPPPRRAPAGARSRGSGRQATRSRGGGREAGWPEGGGGLRPGAERLPASGQALSPSPPVSPGHSRFLLLFFQGWGEEKLGCGIRGQGLVAAREHSRMRGPPTSISQPFPHPPTRALPALMMSCPLPLLWLSS